MPATPLPPLRIAFYITGHGFGHSTRAYVVIQALASRQHDITVVTATPPSLFADVLEANPKTVRLRRDSPVIDPGVLQSDPVSVDVEASFAALQKFLDRREEICEIERRWMESQRLDVVIVDAPFVPVVVAKSLKLPVIMITNFSFDAIYDWIARPEDEHLVSAVRDMYRKADHLLCLPGAIPMPSFYHTMDQSGEVYDVESSSSRRVSPSRLSRSIQSLADGLAESTSPSRDSIHSDASDHSPQRNGDAHASVGSLTPSLLNGATTRTWIPQLRPLPHRANSILQLPLVVRMQRRSREEVRSSLNIPHDAHVLLISFGGFSVTPGEAGWTTDAMLPHGWLGLVAVPSGASDLTSLGPRFIAVQEGSYVPDLVGAVDCVAGKCGYSTCAEVVAHRKPFVYVPRPAFAEEAGLIYNLMKPFGMGHEMPQEDYYSGRWAHHVEIAHNMARKGPAASISNDGGEVAASAVESILRGHGLVDFS